ncbi:MULTISPECIES: aminotransferase class V-fold PLP-dependent enzyme [Micromonospora]|uniref:Aspartate aminotransferase family protein n=1 Tax=Micromonospora solifontis TaxID=2487138 RepID=A0ABX9WBS4_9ACTN|nr:MULTISPECIES: aminotransferase class V-fold PLP-dependent enzyme [Micromonospora]NES12553.1 aspartate aminotransferase family protein [Micromonospora sp. PPF5-17B]NES39178.1 aspartate aminotransferase family protein [Micromonospora solifontis]NES54562.1 aspartate aminotransferase family protein [Micromonospora sp. PPF5-6]RNL90366.1 aspartate aminotransferase family protein [Micromonospora solifontis]
MIDDKWGALPEHGVPAERVLDEIRALRAADRPTHGGRLFAYVYDPGVAGLDELAQAAYAESAHVNGLDPTAFPSLLAMENALVAAAARLLGGGPGTAAPDVVGSVTSGGTESLMLAVKAARDARPDLAAPRIVVPASGHAAFAKAGHYLRVAVDPVPVDPVTLRPSAADVAAAIRPETVLVAASAPSYAHGVVDPVAEIAAVAAAAGVRCHVDACFGGWTLPWLRRLGAPVPPFDFAVDGVTSISVDLHKYAYAPKGVSVLLHRDPALRAPQYFAYADWPGYTMINPVIASTRSGGPIAAAYATLRHLGEDGYLRLAALTRDAVAGLADAVRAVDGLRLLAEPEATVVCFTSDDPGLDLFVLVDELTARGWHTQPQLAYAGLPASVHLTVTAAVAPRVAEFGPALAEAVAATRAAGPVELPAELRALAGSLTPEALTPEVVAGLAAGLGLDPTAAPERMAVVNTLLDAASPALRERLLAEFVGLLQRPSW